MFCCRSGLQLANLSATLLLLALLLLPVNLARSHVRRGHDLQAQGHDAAGSSDRQTSQPGDEFSGGQTKDDGPKVDNEDDQQQQQHRLVAQLLHERQLLLQLLDVEARLAEDRGEQLTRLPAYAR